VRLQDARVHYPDLKQQPHTRNRPHPQVRQLEPGPPEAQASLTKGRETA
jgi:hypothetical protein